MYDGEFENDEPHGVAKMTYKDGRVCQGFWEEGKMLATCTRDSGKMAYGTARELGIYPGGGQDYIYEGEMVN